LGTLVEDEEDWELIDEDEPDAEIVELVPLPLPFEPS
jgi:hypothetical protein